MEIEKLSERYTICRIDPSSSIPDWAKSVPRTSFMSVTYTTEELSIIADRDLVPMDVVREGEWTLFKLVGPLDFALVGILAGVLTSLAAIGIGILAISTYDTDYVLVPHNKTEDSVAALKNAGHKVIE